MKIVVLASLAFSLVNFRGRLLGEMVAAGHEVIACAPDQDPEVESRLAAMGVTYRRVPMARTGFNPFVDLRTLMGFRRLIARERPDAVLAYTQKPIIYGGIAARLGCRPRFFAMVSGLGHAFSEGGSRFRPALRATVAALTRAALKQAEVVFVFNSDDRGEMIHRHIITPESRVVQVPGSGVDLAHFRAAPIPAGPPVFLMVARLLKSKGLFEFVEAARIVRGQHPAARFQLLGPLDPNPAGIGRAQVDAWQAEGAIEYLGETRDVRPYLAAATVFVLPSWYREGLPRTILEAMATGRAVVTANMPGCREPIERGRNGFLVAPRDARALAAACGRFIDDPMLAIRFGAAARATAEQRFSVDRVNALILTTMRLKGDAPVEAREAAAATILVGSG